MRRILISYHATTCVVQRTKETNMGYQSEQTNKPNPNQQYDKNAPNKTPQQPADQQSKKPGGMGAEANKK